MTEREEEVLKLVKWLESTRTTWFFLSMVMFVINLISVPYAVLYILKYGFKL